jgi:hypothetical protein
MRPVKVRDQTTDFTKPSGWEEGQDGPCGTLSVRVEPVGRHNYHYSNWKPDIEELKLLARGGVVELCCVGIQPPVSVAVVPEHKG